MATSIPAPRINNNDDTVLLCSVLPQPGAPVRAGDTICEIETDKATFSVESNRDGYFLACTHSVGDMVKVGSTLIWIGDSPDEEVPTAISQNSPNANAPEPSLKASILMREYGLSAGDIPFSGPRLSAQDVIAFVSSRGIQRGAQKAAAAQQVEQTPVPAATVEELDVQERGMLRTVSWHRTEAIPAYVEIEIEPAPWEDYASSIQKQHGMLLSPLLGLMAYKLVKTCKQNPKLNATVFEGRKYLFQSVNLGFTVQSGQSLYLAVLHAADELGEVDFVRKLSELQKQAMKKKLSPAQSAGATVGFSSMSRWGVVRHQPVLAPHSSIMIAHTATVGGRSALGATYDHRLLTGADAITALSALRKPGDIN